MKFSDPQREDKRAAALVTCPEGGEGRRFHVDLSILVSRLISKGRRRRFTAVPER